MIGVQLDNEIGMLASISNSPDLTDALLADMLRWCTERYGDGLAGRYPVALDPPGWAAALRSPDERWAAALRVDLGWFMRDRFARYVAALAGSARRSQLFATYAGLDGCRRRAVVTGPAQVNMVITFG